MHLNSAERSGTKRSWLWDLAFGSHTTVGNPWRVYPLVARLSFFGCFVQLATVSGATISFLLLCSLSFLFCFAVAVCASVSTCANLISLLRQIVVQLFWIRFPVCLYHRLPLFNLFNSSRIESNRNVTQRIEGYLYAPQNVTVPPHCHCPAPILSPFRLFMIFTLQRVLPTGLWPSFSSHRPRLGNKFMLFYFLLS